MTVKKVKKSDPVIDDLAKAGLDLNPKTKLVPCPSGYDNEKVEVPIEKRSAPSELPSREGVEEFTTATHEHHVLVVTLKLPVGLKRDEVRLMAQSILNKNITDAVKVAVWCDTHTLAQNMKKLDEMIDKLTRLRTP